MNAIPANEELFITYEQLSKSDIRSIYQHKLYWSWNTDCSKTGINEHAGKTSEEWHCKFKGDYLTRIYERDDLGYATMMNTLRKLYKDGYKDDAQYLRNEIIKMTSTTTANVKQFTEYLNEIERFAHGVGIILRTDPKVYQLAYGLK
jgi:hypothetical protein